MTDRQQKKVDRMETNEEKVYTVSQAAMEKIVRTAVAGSTAYIKYNEELFHYLI